MKNKPQNFKCLSKSFVLLELETSRNSLEDTNESENDISRWNGDRVFN